jgi:hypothetical protein
VRWHPLNGWIGHDFGGAGHSSAGFGSPITGHRDPVFLFFSNRLGCLGSLALSLLLTVVVLLALHVL